MNSLSRDEFAERVARIPVPDEPFKPHAVHDPDGDCIEFFIRPDSFYAERVDGLVTVYYSNETDEVVGSLIKGVSGFYRDILKRIPGLAIEIRDGRVLLQHFFLAGLWSKSGADEMTVLTYQKLIRAAEEANIEAELSAAAH